MFISTRNILSNSIAAAVVFSLFPLCQPVTAATRVWTGAGDTFTFNSAGNWDSGAPVSGQGDVLQIDASSESGTKTIFFYTGSQFSAGSVNFLAGAPDYTITANSQPDDTLVLTSALGISNTSNNRQTFSNITTIVSPVTQTYDGGSFGLTLHAIDLGSGHTLTFAGSGVGSAGNVVTGTISGDATSGIVKSGTGLLSLGAGLNTTYGGSTRIQGGTLQLGSNNLLPDASNLILDGGTLSLNGFSETMASLDLNGNAVIDFGSGTGKTFTLAASNGQVWDNFTLTILNGAGNTLKFGNDATGLTASQLLNNIRFDGTTPGQINSSGIVTAAVPEPSSVLLVGLGLASLVARRRSRRS